MTNAFVAEFNPLKQATTFIGDGTEGNDYLLKLKLKQRKCSNNSVNRMSHLELTSSTKTRESSPLTLEHRKCKARFRDSSIQLGRKRLTPFQLYKMKSEESKESLRRKGEMNASSSQSRTIFNMKLTNCGSNRSMIRNLMQKTINKKRGDKTGLSYSTIVDSSTYKKTALPIYLTKKAEKGNSRKSFECLFIVPMRKGPIADKNNDKLNLLKKAGSVLPILLRS